MRKLTKADVTITLKCEPEEMDYVGNCMASGDQTIDRQAEQWIRDQLEAGNEWAWCCVTVTVSWEGFEASDHLGGCSYQSEENFRQVDGYFDDMVTAALETLNHQIAAMDTKLGGLR